MYPASRSLTLATTLLGFALKATHLPMCSSSNTGLAAASQGPGMGDVVGSKFANPRSGRISTDERWVVA